MPDLLLRLRERPGIPLFKCRGGFFGVAGQNCPTPSGSVPVAGDSAAFLLYI